MVLQLVTIFDKMNFDQKLPSHFGLLTKKTKEERDYTTEKHVIIHVIEKHHTDEFLKIIVIYLCLFYPSWAGTIEQTEFIFPSSWYHAIFSLGVLIHDMLEVWHTLGKPKTLASTVARSAEPMTKKTKLTWTLTSWNLHVNPTLLGSVLTTFSTKDFHTILHVTEGFSWCNGDHIHFTLLYMQTSPSSELFMLTIYTMPYDNAILYSRTVSTTHLFVFTPGAVYSVNHNSHFYYWLHKSSIMHFYPHSAPSVPSHPKLPFQLI